VIHSHLSKPAVSFFTEYVNVIHTALSSSDSDLFVCYSDLPGNAQDAPLPSVMSSVQSSLVYLLEATRLHCTDGLIGLLLCTTSSSPLG